MKKSSIIISALLLLLFVNEMIHAQADEYAGMNGKQYVCRITEITPPDVDRMPVFSTETVIFENGRIVFDFLRRFESESIQYTAAIDERRAVAFTVVEFRSETAGSRSGIPVEVSFTGSVVGYVGLSGEIRVTGNGIDEKFTVESVNP